jgi:hypothetical protein
VLNLQEIQKNIFTKFGLKDADECFDNIEVKEGEDHEGFRKALDECCKEDQSKKICPIYIEDEIKKMKQLMNK